MAGLIRDQAEANSKRSESTPKTSTKYLHGTLSYILGKKDIKRSHRTNVMSREAGHLEQGAKFFKSNKQGFAFIRW